MEFFILMISAFILAPLLGTVLCIFLTVFKSGNLKLKIGILTFLYPILYALLLRLILPSIFGELLWLAFLILAIIIRDTVFSNRKYLSNLKVGEGKISIEYITPFLTAKSLEISISDINKLKLSKMATIADYPASLKLFGDNDDYRRFLILDKKIWDMANLTLNAANTSIATSGA